MPRDTQFVEPAADRHLSEKGGRSRQEPSRSKHLKALSLFSGAGGLDIGLTAANFEIVASLEADRDSCETLAANGAGRILERKIEDLPAKVLREQLGLAPGELDLIAGGPPCQPFSKSAFWAEKAAKGLADERADTLRHFMDYIEEFLPKAFLIENVEGFVAGGGLAFVERALADMRAKGLNYSFKWKVLNAAEFGVPQRRKRFFGIGIHEADPFEFPVASHPSPDEWATTWDALSGVRQTYDESLLPLGRWSDLLPSIPEGENYLWHTDRGGGEPLFGWRTRYWSFLAKLARNQAAPTLVASPSQNSGPFHWANRLLSTDELAAIQGFPRAYRFAGTRVSRQRQIGNAVPPLLAQRIGAALAARLGVEAITAPKNLQIARRAPAKQKLPVLAVPEKYLVLRGEHLAHPGTGKGPKPRKT